MQREEDPCEVSSVEPDHKLQQDMCLNSAFTALSLFVCVCVCACACVCVCVRESEKEAASMPGVALKLSSSPLRTINCATTNLNPSSTLVLE